MARRCIALFALLAYLATGVAVSLHYEHHHHGRAILRDASVAVPPGDASATSRCACGHHGDFDASEEKHHRHGGPSPPHDHAPHDHEDDDCVICLAMAEKPIPVAAVTVVNGTQFVEKRSQYVADSPNSVVSGLPLSRAPPLLDC